MQEIGIDLSGHRSEHVAIYDATPMDYVVTVCDNARENCPYVPAKQCNIHRTFSDPSRAGGTSEERLATFRRVRDEIDAWIEHAFR